MQGVQHYSRITLYISRTKTPGCFFPSIFHSQKVHRALGCRLNKEVGYRMGSRFELLSYSLLGFQLA